VQFPAHISTRTQSSRLLRGTSPSLEYAFVLRMSVQHPLGSIHRRRRCESLKVPVSEFSKVPVSELSKASSRASWPPLRPRGEPIRSSLLH
jgi:hypothetical protein